MAGTHASVGQSDKQTKTPVRVTLSRPGRLTRLLLSSDLLRVARWSVLRCGSSSLAVYFCGRRPRRRGPTNTRARLEGAVAPLPAARHRRSCPSPAPAPPLGILALLARLHPRTPRTRPRERGLAPQQRSRSCTSSAHQLQQQRAAKPTRRPHPLSTRPLCPLARPCLPHMAPRRGPPRESQRLPPQRAVPCTTHRSHKTSRDRPHLRRLRCTPHSRETCTPSGRERRPPWACAVRFAPAQHARTHTRLHIQPLASARTTLISCAALYQLHHASLGAVFATQTPPHPGGNPAHKARPMATTVLRYCVLSLVCHVGFAEVDSEAVQQECLFDQPDEIRLNFSGRFALAHLLLPARSKRSLARDRRLQAPRCAATTSVDKVPAPSCALLSRTTGNAGSMTSTPLIRTTRRWVRHCIVACLPHWPMHAAFQVVLRCGSFRQCHGWKDLDETRRCGGPRHHRPDPVRPACELSSPVHYALHAPAHAEVARPFTRARLRP